MATRARKASTPRGSTSRRNPERGASAAGGRAPGDTRTEREPRRPVLDPGDEAFDPARLLGPGHPLGRLTAMFLLQILEWQSTTLELYQRALREGIYDAPGEDHLRKMARTMMSAYLDLVKSAPERRERLLAGQAELARELSAAVDELRRRLDEAPS